MSYTGLFPRETGRICCISNLSSAIVIFLSS